MTTAPLEIALDQLNDLGFGYFQHWEINHQDHQNPEKSIKEYLSDYELFTQLRQHDTEQSIKKAFTALKKDLKQFKLHPIQDWKLLIREKTEEWLNFKSPFSPLAVDSVKQQQLLSNALKEVYDYLDAIGVHSAYYVDEKFNDYFTPWGDQLSFDIVCCSNHKIFIYHTGWSS